MQNINLSNKKQVWHSFMHICIQKKNCSKFMVAHAIAYDLLFILFTLRFWGQPDCANADVVDMATVCILFNPYEFLYLNWLNVLDGVLVPPNNRKEVADFMRTSILCCVRSIITWNHTIIFVCTGEEKVHFTYFKNYLSCTQVLKNQQQHNHVFNRQGEALFNK